MTDVALTQALEERLLVVWPAVTTRMQDGWAIRCANGYSGRANSASALVPGATVSETLLAGIEEIYRASALNPQFRISPLAAPEVQPFLLGHGYRVKDTAITMTMALDQSWRADPRVSVAQAPGDGWLNGISVRQEPSKRSPDHLHAIVSRLAVPAGFATLQAQDTDAGYGFCAIVRGWAELGLIVIDEHLRGQGLGRALVTSLLSWAGQRGATHAFLQVDELNRAARCLYDSLGFIPAYRYTTLVKD